MTIRLQQCKAARALLHWTSSLPAGRVGLSATTIAQFESRERRLLFFDAYIIGDIFQKEGAEFGADGRAAGRK
jgi:hypothetical protein